MGKMTRAEQAAVEAAGAAADHRIAARARKVVEIWNARSELFFYPTIRAAITAGCPWLDYSLPVPGVLPDWRDRPAPGRPSSRRFDFEPDPRAVVPQLSAKSAIRQAYPAQEPLGAICPLTEPC